MALTRCAVCAVDSGETVSEAFTRALERRLQLQARWLDAWQASHLLLAAARLAMPPGAVYDPLRASLLERSEVLRPQRGKDTMPAALPQVADLPSESKALIMHCL